MLYFLYTITLNFPAFHRWGYQFVRHLEFPLIRLVFTLTGVRQVILRNSGKHGQDFNLFVSDVDLSVMSELQNMEFVYHVHKVLKKMFLNLGEIEFYSPDEWSEMDLLLKDPMADTWNQLLLVRKLSWQTRSLSNSGNNLYQKEKAKRGMRITQKKLGIKNESWTLDDLIAEIDSDISEEGTLADFSNFLERKLSFQSTKTARNFWSILPDCRDIPISDKRKELKEYILKREYFLTLVSLRSDMMTGKITDLETKRNWLKDLRLRIESFRVLSHPLKAEKSSIE